MFRVTAYTKPDNEKIVDEFDDEDDLREFVDSCLDDIENSRVKSFVVSSISEKTYTKPFWEE